MQNKDVSVRFFRIFPGEDWHEALSVRFPVFLEEQGFPYEIDVQDPISYHLIGFLGQKPVCTARIIPNGAHCFLGRVAVLKGCRGLGVGRLLLEEALLFAGSLGFACVEVHAQMQAVGYYQKAGFVETGAPFLEDQVLHVSMSKAL